MMHSTFRAAAPARPGATIGSRMADVKEILCPICHKPNPFRERTRFCQHCGTDVILNNERESPGDSLRYYITRIIKRGGQGAVYAGIDQHFKLYAIKEMLDRFTDERERQEALDRFNEEAQLLQGLSHPRIPRVYSHFTDGGRHYLTMDFVQGEDLEMLVSRQGSLPEAQVLKWADQVSDVLHYLHRQGLIYRDMKPSNIMIEPDGGVKLVDFGIAKNFTPTERGTQIGTPGYAPPEQYQGFATPASDIYALAATLHHLLTGRDPTEKPPFSFPPARDVNPAVSVRTSSALEKALKMRPEDRFATVAEFRASLRPLAAATPVQVRVSPQRASVPAAQTAPAPVPQAAPQAAKQAAKEAARRAAVPPRQPSPLVRPAMSRRSALSTIAAQIQRFFVRLFVTVLVLATLLLAAVAGLYIWQPDLLRPYLPAPVEQLLPQADPAPALNTVRFSAELEIMVPAGADSAALREQFIDAYEQAARAQFGDVVIINRNAPPRYLGAEPVMVGAENGQERWRVTMEGFISAP